MVDLLVSVGYQGTVNEVNDNPSICSCWLGNLLLELLLSPRPAIQPIFMVLFLFSHYQNSKCWISEFCVRGTHSHIQKYYFLVYATICSLRLYGLIKIAFNGGFYVFAKQFVKILVFCIKVTPAIILKISIQDRYFEIISVQVEQTCCTQTAYLDLLTRLFN